MGVGGETDRDPGAGRTCRLIGQAAISDATFVELPVIAAGGGCECVLEWADRGGARMRMELKKGVLPASVHNLWCAMSESHL